MEGWGMGMGMGGMHMCALFAVFVCVCLWAFYFFSFIYPLLASVFCLEFGKKKKQGLGMDLVYTATVLCVCVSE